MLKAKKIIICVLLIFLFVFCYWFLFGSDKGILSDGNKKNILSEQISLNDDINNFNQAYKDSKDRVNGLEEKFYLCNVRTDSLNPDVAKYIEFKYVEKESSADKKIKIYRYYYGKRIVEIVSDYSSSTVEIFDQIDNIDEIMSKTKLSLNILSTNGINNITDIECYQNRADIYVCNNNDNIKISIEYLKP